VTLALVDELRRWPLADFEAALALLTPEEQAALAFEWLAFWARPDQLPPPGFWSYWWLFGGRGSGKTRSAAQWVNHRARLGLGPIRFVAGTYDDIRDTMIEGVSGILASASPDFMPVWEPSRGEGGRVTWPNGVVGRGYSAEKPRRMHGKAGQTDWYDDLTGWGIRAKETFDMAAFGLREGDARAVLTASPEESELIISLCDNPRRGVVTTHSETDDNIGNLAPSLLQTLSQFAGTAMEQRQRKGVMIRSVEGNPFRDLNFEAPPIRIHEPGAIAKLAIAVDPADGAGPDNDEWGIGAAGARADGHGVGLEDASGVLEDDAAGERALELVDRWGGLFPAAEVVIVAEDNRGAGKVRAVLNSAYWRRKAEGRTARPPPEIVCVTAKDGKLVRGGPLRGPYLAGTLHHLLGMAPVEAQQRIWNPSAPRRPRVDDRIDWWVHAVHRLLNLGAAVVDPGSWESDAPMLEGRYAAVDPRRAEEGRRRPSRHAGR